MTTNVHKRGSEWRKWDLHIHTPASFHWNGGKSFSAMDANEKAVVIKEIVDKMNATDVAVFATMDYWTFDGYLEIVNYLKSTGAVSLKKSLFPGIELRIEAATDFRLNIHVILSPDLSSQQLSDFKSRLCIRVNNRPLSNDALIDFAKRLDPSKARHHGFTTEQLKSDDNLLKLGSMTAEITKASLEEAISSLPEGSALVIMPYDTSDGLAGLDWEKHPVDDLYFMQSAHIFETRSPDNVDLFLARKNEKNKKFFDNFLKTMGGKAKPVISGSDAHKINDYGIFYGDRITWIKADPTFEGLRQTLNEPEARCYIGKIPDKLQKIDLNKTKYFKSIIIGRSDNAAIDEIWFDNEIEFNPELVAIIGNKGSGKSALGDIIGLVSNSKQHNSFSFLSAERFREKKGTKAGKFKAILEWESGNKFEAKLDSVYDPLSVETVKYIPQNYLEKVCNETAFHSGSLFNNELKEVIFSHIDNANRLGQKSLDDLLNYKTNEVSDKIEILKSELVTILEKIIACEEKLDSAYEKNLLNKLDAKNVELDAHLKARPAEVVKPVATEEDRELDTVTIELSALRDKLLLLETDIENFEKEKNELLRKSAMIQKCISQIDNFKKQVDLFIDSIKPNFETLNLNITKVLTISVDKTTLSESSQQANTRLEDLGKLLDNEDPQSLISQKNKIVLEIQEKEKKLDEPNRLYRDYVAALLNWEKIRDEINGSVDVSGSIIGLNKLLVDIKEIPTTLTSLEDERDAKVVEIYSEISGLAATYKDLYASVQSFVENNPIADERFQMQFDVSIMCNGLKENFFDLLLRNVAGSFCGIAESEKMFLSILEKYDFSTVDQVKSFTNELLEHLQFDCRTKDKPKVNVATQIKKGDVLSIYKTIFCLDYLKPEYSLKLNNKGLAQLSPGERGTLLLIFYLLVDRDSRPIILDQPEENLDNQTIFKVLVPCIKAAKRTRQIILVTHNPNLAVVCDAEQIIVANIDKKNKNKVSYVTGAIENFEINKLIVDILEGTRPAFDNRDSKYLLK